MNNTDFAILAFPNKNAEEIFISKYQTIVNRQRVMTVSSKDEFYNAVQYAKSNNYDRISSFADDFNINEWLGEIIENSKNGSTEFIDSIDYGYFTSSKHLPDFYGTCWFVEKLSPLKVKDY